MIVNGLISSEISLFSIDKLINILYIYIYYRFKLFIIVIIKECSNNITLTNLIAQRVLDNYNYLSKELIDILFKLIIIYINNNILLVKIKIFDLKL